MKQNRCQKDTGTGDILRPAISQRRIFHAVGSKLLRESDGVVFQIEVVRETRDQIRSHGAGRLACGGLGFDLFE